MPRNGPSFLPTQGCGHRQDWHRRLLPRSFNAPNTRQQAETNAVIESLRPARLIFKHQTLNVQIRPWTCLEAPFSTLPSSLQKRRRDVMKISERGRQTGYER